MKAPNLIKTNHLWRFSYVYLLYNLIFCTNAYGQSFADAVQMAIDNSYSLKAEAKRLEVINEQKIQANNMLRPNIQMETGAGLRSYGTWSGAFGENKMRWQGLEPMDISISASQPLMQGGRYQATRRRADLNYAQGAARYKSQEMQVVKLAISYYAGVLRDYSIYNIRQDGVKNLNRQLEATKARKEVGLIGLTDVAQVETRLAAANGQLASAKARLMSSWGLLQSLLVKKDLSLTDNQIIFSIPHDKDEAQEIAINNNIDIKVSRFNEDIARAGAQIARTEYSPNISLNANAIGSLDSGFNGSRNVDTQLSLKVTIPIWSGGRNASQIRSNLFESEAAYYENKDIEEQLKQQVIISWENYYAASENVKFAEAQINSAKIAREGAQLEQRIGARTTLDVLNQEQEVLDAKINLSNAKYEELNAGVTLQILMGNDPTGVSKDENQFEISKRLQSSIDDKFGKPQKWEMPFIGLQNILVPLDTSLKHKAKYINKALGEEK